MAGYPLEDVGTWSEESVDYPDYGKAVGKRVANHQADSGSRCAAPALGFRSPRTRCLKAREHNDANVLAMGGRVVNGKQAIEMVQTFLSTAFHGGRHTRQVEKISLIEWEARQRS